MSTCFLPPCRGSLDVKFGLNQAGLVNMLFKFTSRGLLDVGFGRNHAGHVNMNFIFTCRGSLDVGFGLYDAGICQLYAMPNDRVAAPYTRHPFPQWTDLAPIGPPPAPSSSSCPPVAPPLPCRMWRKAPGRSTIETYGTENQLSLLRT